jgi:hypothetical protein
MLCPGLAPWYSGYKQATNTQSTILTHRMILPKDCPQSKGFHDENIEQTLLTLTRNQQVLSTCRSQRRSDEVIA